MNDCHPDEDAADSKDSKRLAILISIELPKAKTNREICTRLKSLFHLRTILSLEFVSNKDIDQ